LNTIQTILESLFFGSLGALISIHFHNKGASNMDQLKNFTTQTIYVEDTTIADVAELAAQTGAAYEETMRFVIEAGLAMLKPTPLEIVPSASAAGQAALAAAADAVAAQDAAIAKAQAALDAAFAAKAAAQQPTV
jgi:hypothetical protein